MTVAIIRARIIHTWLLVIDQGGMTSSIYDTTVDVNYPIAFTRKVFGGSLTAIYNRSSDGGAVAYLNLTDLRKCKITRDTIGSAFTSPIAYIVIGY